MNKMHKTCLHDLRANYILYNKGSKAMWPFAIKILF